jgi:hypothetical protein
MKGCKLRKTRRAGQAALRGLQEEPQRMPSGSELAGGGATGERKEAKKTNGQWRESEVRRSHEGRQRAKAAATEGARVEPIVPTACPHIFWLRWRLKETYPQSGALGAHHTF